MATRETEVEMFWWIVLAVVVVGFAVAWWTSGRAKGRRSPIDPSTDPGASAGRSGHQHNQVGRMPGGPFGP